jgi:AcrR family transcriptional regulator
MVKWTKEEINRQLQEFCGGGDPDDPKERKRLRIIEAATELFVKYGLRKTSIDEVARRAGVAKGTIYTHFKTKAA